MWQLWPNYLAYLISFAIIGVMWLNHHRMFEQVRIVDGGLLVLNLNLLLWMALIPFPTAVVADFIRDGGANASTAVAFYSGVVLARRDLVQRALRVDPPRRPHHGRAPAARGGAARRGAGSRSGSSSTSLALGLSFVVPWVALALHGAMAGYYLFDQASVPSGEPA